MSPVNYPVSRRRIIRYGLPATVLLSLVLWPACTVGPNFKAPKAQVPDQWVGKADPPATPAEQNLAQWWKVFQDSTLTSLEDRAIQSNLNLKQAEVRIRQARASRSIAKSGLGPTVDHSSSIRRSHSGGGGSGFTSNQFQAGFDSGWEFDIFGGVRRGVEAADADLQGTIESRRDVLVSLTAEVAVNYVNLRTYQQEIVIAQKNLAAQQHTAELTHKRFEAGFVGRLDVANADAQVATTQSQIPLLESSVQQTIYSLSVLLGQEPGALVQELSPVGEIPSAPPSVPTGVPSDLLRRRPDIRAAEAQIHSDTARIGVATADLFPQFSIAPNFGFSAGKPGSWFSWVSRFWSFGPSVSWHIFDNGRIKSNIELQKAFQQEDFIVYQQTVLTALQEVENALIASSKEQEHRQSVETAVTSNQQAVALATKLYVAGETNFLNVLDAQRSLYASEDALVQSNGNVSTDLIALYKAFGGGWS